MELLAETYVVLDVPEPFASRVLELRRRSGDDFRAALPAEITLIGSGGAGPIMRRQPLNDLVERVRAVAKSTSPVHTSFSPPIRFPESDVFVFPLSETHAVVELQRNLCAAGLVYRASPWPFVPHCTIRSRSPIAEAEAAAVLEERLEGSFVLDTMSIYTAELLPDLVLLERLSLRLAI